ncbi:MAG: hypothetical protein KA257_03405 [Opitutaceae bacterium]|nr:hypothetical protein [Opitutaceae bacterium]
MSTLLAEPTAPVSTKRTVLIDAQSKQKPRTVDLLNDWQYIEKSIHRLIAAWGRDVAEWNDKSMIHRHIWDQAECVRRLRERVEQFPGGKADAPVSARLEQLVNTALLAPSLDDALDAIYELLLKTLVGAYGEYIAQVHPIHDAPTITLLHEINQIKSQEWLWYRDYRRRHPHKPDAAFRARVTAALADCGQFRAALPVSPGAEAQPAGVNTDFRPSRYSARTEPIRAKQPFMDYVRADFVTSIEARRLFWAFGYMLEKNLPDDQLSWLYFGHYMPWEWHHDISRHLWDESRHGDSGYSRLCDFGISLDEVGFSGYDQGSRDEELKKIAAQQGFPLDEAYARQRELLAPFKADPITPQQMYEHVFMIGMVAETGHFVVKNESYVDFKEGHDLESAEMMLFDIIDETAHVQYAHKWLPLLAQFAGVDNSGYRERGAKMREECLTRANGTASALGQKLSRTPGDPTFDFYQDLLARIRASYPLANADTCPPRSPKPM